MTTAFVAPWGVWVEGRSKTMLGRGIVNVGSGKSNLSYIEDPKYCIVEKRQNWTQKGWEDVPANRLVAADPILSNKMGINFLYDNSSNG